MSTDRQLDGHSLDRQVKATKAYCEQNNLELIDELADIGLSGYSGANVTKGQLGQLFQALETGNAPEGLVVVVESLDRLSRQNPLTALTQFSKMLDYGIELHTLFDRQVYTKETVGANAHLLFVSIGSMIRSFEESETKSKRLKAVWAKKKQDQSTIVTSQVPYWINVNKDTKGKAKSFELRSKEASIIREIFDLSINQNLGAQAITSYLNKNLDRYPRTRVSSRNKDQGWAESYIKSILNNPAVYGVYQPHKRINGKRVPDGDPFVDYYPAVITKEEFLLNQSKLAQRKITGKGRKSTTFKNLFRGLLYCRSCGSKISYKFAEKNKGGPVLRCDLAKQGRAGCNSLAVRYQPFEDLFFHVMKDVDFISAINDNDFKNKKRNLELEISGIEEKLSIIDQQMDSLIDEMIDPSKPQGWKSKIQDKITQLTAQQETLTKRLEPLKEEVLLVGNGVGELFDDVRSLMDGVEGDDLVLLRSSVNVGLQRVVGRIEIDNLPLFFRDEVEDGMVEEEDLNPEFLDWFRSTRTDKWLIQEPLVYVASRVGFKMHQDFRTTTYIHFKNGETRGVLADGSFFKVNRSDATTGK